MRLGTLLTTWLALSSATVPVALVQAETPLKAKVGGRAEARAKLKAANKAARGEVKQARKAFHEDRKASKEALRESLKAAGKDVQARKAARQELRTELKGARAEKREAVKAARADRRPARAEARAELKTARKATRKARRKARWQALKAKSGGKLSKPSQLPKPARVELKRHARRMARIARIEALGKAKSKPAWVSRAAALRSRESARHTKVLETVLARSQAPVATPATTDKTTAAADTTETP